MMDDARKYRKNRKYTLMDDDDGRKYRKYRKYRRYFDIFMRYFDETFR